MLWEILSHMEQFSLIFQPDGTLIFFQFYINFYSILEINSKFLNFLISPCIVGNLWDVTDRDIDRLTEEFLDSWIKNHEDPDKNNPDSSSICFHLTKSRASCKMQYLNGSAPIVYGLPVNFK